jgi:hypothetical protein
MSDIPRLAVAAHQERQPSLGGWPDRMAVVATVLCALAAGPVSAFDAQPDKPVAGGIATNSDDWTKGLEADLASFALDMWRAQKRLEEKGFRVNRGNKSPSGWWLTASNRNTGHSIKAQSDGTKLVVTAEEQGLLY